VCQFQGKGQGTPVSLVGLEREFCSFEGPTFQRTSWSFCSGGERVGGAEFAASKPGGRGGGGTDRAETDGFGGGKRWRGLKEREKIG